MLTTIERDNILTLANAKISDTAYKAQQFECFGQVEEALELLTPLCDCIRLATVITDINHNPKSITEEELDDMYFRLACCSGVDLDDTLPIGFIVIPPIIASNVPFTGRVSDTFIWDCAIPDHYTPTATTGLCGYLEGIDDKFGTFDITLNIIPRGTGTGIEDGTWRNTGNRIEPTVPGSNIGDATHRIGTLFMASTINYSTDLVIKSGVQEAIFKTTGEFGVGIDPSPSFMGDFRKNHDGTTTVRSRNTTNNNSASARFIVEANGSIQGGFNAFSSAYSNTIGFAGHIVIGANNASSGIMISPTSRPIRFGNNFDPGSGTPTFTEYARLYGNDTPATEGIFSMVQKGIATGTGDQQDSNAHRFEGGMWDGSAPSTKDFTTQLIASLTGNEEAALRYSFDGTPLLEMPFDGSIKFLAALTNDNAEDTLLAIDVNGKLITRSGATIGVGTFLPLGGGTMTGPIVLPDGVKIRNLGDTVFMQFGTGIGNNNVKIGTANAGLFFSDGGGGANTISGMLDSTGVNALCVDEPGNIIAIATSYVLRFNEVNSTTIVRGSPASDITLTLPSIAGTIALEGSFGTVNTTNATVTTVDTIDTLIDDSTHTILVYITCEQDNNANGGSWNRILRVTKRSGTPVIQSDSSDFFDGDSGFVVADVTFAVSGGNVLIRIRGNAGENLRWDSKYLIINKTTN